MRPCVSPLLQAWVVFEKAEDAQKAMEAMQGFPFFDKPIVSAGGTAAARQLAGAGLCAQLCCCCDQLSSPLELHLSSSSKLLCSPGKYHRPLRVCCSPRMPPSLPVSSCPQRISLAKTKSDAVSKLDGTFRERPKAERRKKDAEGGCGARCLSSGLAAMPA